MTLANTLARKKNNIIDIKRCAIDNILSNNMPMCFYNGSKIKFKFGFEKYINEKLFEGYLKNHYKEIIKFNKPFKYICVTTVENELKIFKLNCFNSYIENKYHATSFFIYELINDYDLSSIIIGRDKLNFNEKELDISLLTNQEWEVVWLLSIGIKRKKMSELLNIKYQSINQRLNRAKNKIKTPINEIPFLVKKNNLILRKIPKRFQTNKIITLI